MINNEPKELFKGLLPLNEIKANAENPRTIKREQLERLKDSIKAFPQMLYLRPLIINKDKVILGGNMRLKALKELNYSEVPVIIVEDLTPEQEKEFVLKDNLNYGEWNWDILSTDWDLTSISNWGLDIPKWVNDDEAEPEFDEDINHNYLDTYINSKIKQIVLFLSAEQYEETINNLQRIMENEGLESNTEVILHLIEKYDERNRA